MGDKRYRCPYCGEEAFSMRQKLKITTVFGNVPKCPHCGNRALRKLGKLPMAMSSIIYVPVELLLLASLVLAPAGYRVPAFIAAVFVTIVFALVSELLLKHFTVYYNADVCKRRFSVLLDGDYGRLWPHFRYGEIYTLCVDHADTAEENKKVFLIAQAEEINGNRMCFRLIRDEELLVSAYGKTVTVQSDKYVVGGTIESA